VSFHENSARRTLLGLGYSEAVSLSFADAEEVGLYRLADSAPVRIRNPLTSDTELLRTSLVPGLVRAARRNFNFNRHVVRLFELGKAYWNGADGPSERRMLCILGTGSFTGNNWRQPGEEYDFFHLKGVVDALLRSMRCPDAAFRPAETAPFLNPADAAIVSLAGASVGCLGSLLPSIAEALKLRQPVFVAELDFAELTRRAFLPVKFEPLAKYPSVERDLSAVVSRNVRYDDVRDAIRDLGIAELVTVELMDVYEGPQVSAGKLSMLLRFIFQDREATLTVDRVQGFSDNIRALLRDKFGAEFR
jgi:phenylalanyl-tRNA synthetase beta chain